MKKTVRILMRGGLTVIFMAAMFAQAFAADKLKAADTLKQVAPATTLVAPATTVSVPTKADLSVNAIHAARCACDLSNVDALYMGDIRVDVGKSDISTPAALRTEPSTVVGYLKVTYHDLIAGRLVTHNLMIQNSQVNRTITVVSTPVLVKKSVGIKAEIQLNTGYAQIDPNPGNNVKTINSCQVLIY